MNANRNKYQNIVVLGAAESGCGAALLAHKMGKSVFVSDSGTIQQKNLEQFAKFDIPFETGQHTLNRLLKADLIVKSPGIPETAVVMQKLREAQKTIVSEIEFASWFTNAKLIGITGSNGKTTTTSLIGHILKQSGIDACVAGNIGKSFSAQLFESNHDVFVLELSSFQLDDSTDFKVDIAILLNITPDHLDRYDNNMEKYARSKMRITQNQTVDDIIIYNADDEWTRRAIAFTNPKSTQYTFSLTHEVEQGAWLCDNNIFLNVNSISDHMNIEELALQGKHNIANSMAAGIASKLVGIRSENLKKSLSDFTGLSHRLEYVANVHGVSYINDSKATNVNATWYALESMNKPVVWIVGGIDKGNDYSELKPLVAKKVRAMICLGIDNEKLHEEFDDLITHIVDANSMEEAVLLASEIAQHGDTVLLSPACASFDLFKNYEERGDLFKSTVKRL